MRDCHSCNYDPELYQKVKESVTMQQVAEYYGLSVNRKGLCLCPFHNDKNPALRQRRRREEGSFLTGAKKILTEYRGLLCEAIRKRNEHFFEGLDELTYIEYLIECLEQCPDELYADKKAVRKIGEIERRIDSWD